jgi:signal transduction histidine kinase
VTTAPRDPDLGRRLTVQGWLVILLAVIGAMLLAGTVAIMLLLNRTDAVSRELNERIQPARILSYQLQAALRDQETAIRGYVISADNRFLQPYIDGQLDERAVAQQIRGLIDGYPQLVTDLDNIERAAQAWRSGYADPQVATVIPTRPAVPDQAVIDRAKADFDQIRVLFDASNEHLTVLRADYLDRLAQAQRWRDLVLVAVLIVLIATGAGMGLLIRNAVTRPLEVLASACRRITEGHFGERIVPRGPRDIRGIGMDVEDMRQRIVDELDESQSARIKLAEQAAALDEQAVELRRSNAELEQFAYVASHDLQEPLRKVASFSQLIEKRYGDKLDARGVEYIGFAVDGAKRMQILINDLLTFSRVGRLGVVLADIDLDTTLDEALQNVAGAIEESDAQIVRRQPLPHTVGDPMLLTMLWQNLIGNAVKFRRAGVPPVIEIDCFRTGTADDAVWEFSVSDNGIGIAEEFVDKVFVIFQRLHGRDAYAGTGIGLALCKKIVEYHGGSIWIDTGYTDGTRFRFTLPVPAPSTPDDGIAVQEGINP